MNHEELQDLLEGYVEETLDRETRRQVEAHLAGCEECRAILEGIPPVGLGNVAATWDDRGMRRAVRRSMFRIAVDALLLLFVGWLVAWILALLILQPFILNRGDRAVAATIATVDAAIMLNPGVTVEEYSYRSGMAARFTEVDLALPVGSAMKSVGTIDSRIGLLGFGDIEGGLLFPFLSGGVDRGEGAEHLAAVGAGTVATVDLWFEPSMDPAAAQKIVDSEAADVSVVWAGFEVAAIEGSDLAPSGILGYGTCGSFPITVSRAAGSSGGGSGTALGGPASVTDALDETRRAVGSLVEHPDLLAGLGASVDDASSALARLERPQVAELVVTGPTPEVLRFIDEAEPDAVSVIEFEFINWSQPPCGR
ncbi:MAG TPA: zf-HC2 domain-containing protein [Acidimicrobiia bacterium]|nr:zf-HC2 domain-containing protein [Acidimicrobiia bacterium]